MSQASCINDFIKFLGEITGRLSFEIVEKRFSKALDENPVFANIEREGAFGKNIIIILGGRGCGKTLMIRYIKYRFTKEGWEFKYIDGPAFKDIKSPDELQQIISEQESMLTKDPSYRIILAIDDVAEVNEIAREKLQKDATELVRKYSGRVKLVLASQSERIGTLELLKIVLGQAPSAEMFFGENPEKSIIDNFKSSYVNRRPVILFRGAALVNLDAYWSRLRSLNMIEGLAEAITKLTEFYAKNSDAYCSETIEKVNSYKHGLALLALSSIPKIINDPTKIIIEYRGAESAGARFGGPASALNGLGIAELLRAFFAEPNIERLADEAERIYSKLKEFQVSSVSVDDVKEVLRKACEALHITFLTGIPASSISPSSFSEILKQAGSGRRKYGPRVDIIEVKGDELRGEVKYIVLFSLKTDKKNYVTSGSINKLRKLVQAKIPSEAELRYLIVLIPAKMHIRALYSALGFAEIKRIGRDVLVVLIDSLSSIENAFIYLVKTEVLNTGEKISQELREVMHMIVISTLTLSLRDVAGVPQLTYLMLPYIS